MSERVHFQTGDDAKVNVTAAINLAGPQSILHIPSAVRELFSNYDGRVEQVVVLFKNKGVWVYSRMPETSKEGGVDASHLH